MVSEIEAQIRSAMQGTAAPIAIGVTAAAAAPSRNGTATDEEDEGEF